MADVELEAAFERIEEKTESLDNIKKRNFEEAKKNMLTQAIHDVLQYLATRQEDHATEEIVRYIEKNYAIYTIKSDIKSEMLFYSDGWYQTNGESFVREVTRKILLHAFTPQRANKVIAKIQADTFIESDILHNKQLENKNEICLENGILNIETRELSDHTPEKIFLSKIPVAYNPKSKCPETLKFLKEVLKNPEDVNVSFEIAGLSLYRKYIIQMAIMLFGDGENGKGVYVNHLRKFMGEPNCSCVPLNQLNPDSFSVCGLFGKLANLAGDISNTDLKDTGTFKELSSGTDKVAAKRKFLPDLYFENYATLLFSCNELPRVYDFTHGFWRRWLLLEFPYKFLKEKEYNLVKDKTNIKKADPEIINKISSPEEMSGFLNMALDGLNRLKDKKQFSHTKSTSQLKEFWVRKSDSFTAFCMDMLEESTENYVLKKEIRKEFNLYCKQHKIKGAGDKNIKAVLQDMFGVVETRKVIGDDFERDYVWEGICFKPKNKVKVKDAQGVHGFSTLGENGSLSIGEKTIGNIDINQKNAIELLEALQILSKDKELIPKSDIQQLPFENLEELLIKLKESGKIYEAKPDSFKLLG